MQATWLITLVMYDVCVWNACPEMPLIGPTSFRNKMVRRPNKKHSTYPVLPIAAQ